MNYTPTPSMPSGKHSFRKYAPREVSIYSKKSIKLHSKINLPEILAFNTMVHNQSIDPPMFRNDFNDSKTFSQRNKRLGFAKAMSV